MVSHSRHRKYKAAFVFHTDSYIGVVDWECLDTKALGTVDITLASEKSPGFKENLAMAVCMVAV
jgi:hypothetical protein